MQLKHVTGRQSEMLRTWEVDCLCLFMPYLLRQSHKPLFVTGRQNGTDSSKESDSCGKVPLDLRKPTNI